MKYSALAMLAATTIFFSTFAFSQQISKDRHAVFKTHMPFLQAQPVHTASSSVTMMPLQPTPATTFGGSSYIVGSTITASSTIPEAEEEIAADPQDSSVLFAVISDFSIRGGFNTTKVAYSNPDDGPNHWESYFLPFNSKGYLETSDGALWQANSDPVVVMGNGGYLYISSLYLNGNNRANGLYVGAAQINFSTNSFTGSINPVKTNRSGTTTSLEDKPWIAVDNTAHATGGNVYASWTHFISDSNGNLINDYIVFSRSSNHGQSWSAPIRISAASQDGAVQGSQVAVAPSGTIYVVYEVFYVNGLRRQFLTRSTNAGASFSTPVAITPYFNEVDFKSDYRINSFPAIAINPKSGYVYVVWSEQTAAGAQVEFIRSSSTGSLRFTAPQVLNDSSAGEHFFPAISVDPSTESINVAWFDTRHSPTNADYYRVYATRSIDNGAIWAPNADVSQGYYSGKNSFIGDYMGIVAASGQAHPVWTSGGFNHGDLKTATLQ
jgi:hypothetical protein